MSKQWHMYGAVLPDGHPFAGCWMSSTLGPVEAGPDSTKLSSLDNGGFPLPYLATWDHEPTEAEKESFTPESHRHDPAERDDQDDDDWDDDWDDD